MYVGYRLTSTHSRTAKSIKRKGIYIQLRPNLTRINQMISHSDKSKFYFSFGSDYCVSVGVCVCVKRQYVCAGVSRAKTAESRASTKEPQQH